MPVGEEAGSVVFRHSGAGCCGKQSVCGEGIAFRNSIIKNTGDRHRDDAGFGGYDFRALCGRMDLYGRRKTFQQPVSSDVDGTGAGRIRPDVEDVRERGETCMKRIAVVEDEPLMREELSRMLRHAGYHVEEILEFHQAAEQLEAISPDLVILDLNLPGASGFQICREVKGRNAFPVLILTSRDQMRDELQALALGADEYLTKPCRKERLLARVANVLKRYEGRSNLLEGEEFLLDRQTYTLYIHNTSVVLPKNQGKLLETFLSHLSRTVTKEDLCMALWGTTEFIDENALQVNLTRLKKTMTGLGMKQKILPVRGVGYRLESGEHGYEG